MSYSDLDKRREVTRERVRRYRMKGKDVTPSSEVVTPNVTPEFVKGMGEWVKLRGVAMKDVGHSETPVKRAIRPPASPQEEPWRKQKGLFMSNFMKGK